MQKPVAIDKKIEIRPMINLGVTIDHRFVDGARCKILNALVFYSLFILVHYYFNRSMSHLNILKNIYLKTKNQIKKLKGIKKQIKLIIFMENYYNI